MTKVKAQISNECQMTNAKKYVTTQVQSSMVHGSRLTGEDAQWGKDK